MLVTLRNSLKKKKKRNSLRDYKYDRDKKGGKNRIWDETKPDIERGQMNSWIYTRPVPSKKEK
jgi:hypothetical protein